FIVNPVLYARAHQRLKIAAYGSQKNNTPLDMSAIYRYVKRKDISISSLHSKKRWRPPEASPFFRNIYHADRRVFRRILAPIILEKHAEKIARSMIETRQFR